MSSEGKRWTINVCTCGGSGMNEPSDHWTHDGPHEVEEIEVVPASEIERLREALQFYADPANYTPYENAPAERHVGGKARAALADDEKEEA